MDLMAKRLQAIKPSPTLAITAQARELKAQGINIISLSVGEPDFDTPDHIKQAAIEGINAGATKYTAVPGMPELKAAVINKFQRDNNLTYQPEEIIVSTGGKQVIYNLFMATLNSSDEVIIPAPYWVSYPDIVLLAGATPVISEPTQDLQLDLVDLASKINNRTKWLILNSPSNPSGVVYDQNSLIALADLLRQHPQIHIMCDDIYEHIIFDQQKFMTLANVAPDLKERIFIINGVSKAYAMTGWRIGYGAGNAKIIKAMNMIQSQSTSGACSVSQVAAIEALNGPQDYLSINAKQFEEKRDLVLKALAQIPAISCIKPSGAFYLFPNCTKLFGKTTPDGKIINDCTDFAAYLLQKANIAVVPGSAFGLPGYFRISYATSKALLTEALARLQQAVTDLR